MSVDFVFALGVVALLLLLMLLRCCLLAVAGWLSAVVGLLLGGCVLCVRFFFS